MDQFRDPKKLHPKGSRKNNPVTPIPQIFSQQRDTDKLNMREYYKRLNNSLEDTTQQPIPPLSAYPSQTKYTRGKQSLSSTALFNDAVDHHVDRRADKKPPKLLLIGESLYYEIKICVERRSSEPFEDIFTYVAQGSKQIFDIRIECSKSIPAEIIYCIH